VVATQATPDGAKSGVRRAEHGVRGGRDASFLAPH
jgi:hypothetical protein